MNSRIFVTGATGYLGSAITARLVRTGAEVFGLARSDDKARAIEALGARPVPGTLESPAEWIGQLKNCDAVVHAASDSANAAEQDQRVLDAVRECALDGRVRRLLYTSGVWVYGPSAGVVLDETSPRRPLELVSWRTAHEEIAFDLSSHEVQTVVLQPGMVYGEHRGILGMWFDEARRKKTVTCWGDGSQHWPMVHRDDLAEAYALALEHGRTGERYILADESHHTVKDMADAVAAATGAKVQPFPADPLKAAMGLFGSALLNDLQVSAAKARRELGWVPRHTSFVAEAPALWREWQEARETPVA